MAFSKGTAYGFGSDPSDDWRERALCRDYDPELFFPVGNADASEAKAICRRCPVIDECFKASTGQFGVWAGLDENERRAGEMPKVAYGNALINQRKTHCSRMHPFDKDNTYIDARGSRHCRTCARERVRDMRHQRAEEVWA